MASEAMDSTQTQNSSSSTGGNGDTGDFECNICFDLAQDPVVTLCGHLFCWPCLYRWLHLHSHSHECPVCKALIQEEKLVPLYGRGKTETDPRSKPIPGVEIPNRPAGERPETAPPPGASGFLNFAFGLSGGFLPVSVGFGHFGMLSGFGGFLPSMLSIQIHGLPMWGTTSGFAPGLSGAYHGANVRRAPETTQGQQAEDYKLVSILAIILVLVIIFLTW